MASVPDRRKPRASRLLVLAARHERHLLYAPDARGEAAAKESSLARGEEEADVASRLTGRDQDGPQVFLALGDAVAAVGDDRIARETAAPVRDERAAEPIPELVRALDAVDRAAEAGALVEIVLAERAHLDGARVSREGTAPQVERRLLDLEAERFGAMLDRTITPDELRATLWTLIEGEALGLRCPALEPALG